MLKEKLLSKLIKQDYYNLNYKDYTKHTSYNLLK